MPRSLQARLPPEAGARRKELLRKEDQCVDGIKEREGKEESAFRRWVSWAQHAEKEELEEIVVSCRQSEMFQKKGTAPKSTKYCAGKRQ